MTANETNAIRETIKAKTNEELVDYFAFIESRIATSGLVDALETRFIEARNELIARLNATNN